LHWSLAKRGTDSGAHCPNKRPADHSRDEYLGAVVYSHAGKVNIKQGVILAVGLIVGNLLGAILANQTTSAMKS